MKTRLRLGLTLLLALVLSFVVHYVFALLNLPSDITVLAGTASVVVLFLIVPSVLWKIWTKKEKVNEPTKTDVS